MSGGEDEPKLTVPKFSSFKSKGPAASSAAGKDQGGEPVVPKFSSFKPKGSGSSSADRRDRGKGSEHGDERKRRHRSHKERDHDSKRRRHESHRRDGQPRRSRSPKDKTERRPDLTAVRDLDTPSSVFFFDKEGDRLILRYGGIERSKIPAYHRYGAGRVLGTTGRLISHREGARDLFSLRMPGEGSALFREKDGLRTKAPRLRRSPFRLRPRRRDAQEEDDEGYLPLESSKKGQQDAQDADPSSDEEQPDYRSIEGKAKAKAQIDIDSSDGSESEDEVPALDRSNPLKWRSIQLSRRVKEHAEDIDAWIELVDHQDALLRAGESVDREVLENEAHSYSEIKVSMLESALSNTSNPSDRSRVLNYLMREGVKVWNTKTAEKKWLEILQDEQDNFTLWKTHLDFSMSNIASLQYDDIKKTLLRRLNQAVSRAASGHAQNALPEAVYVFLRATRFIHDAGFKELAVAAWQAQLEMTFFRPSGLGGSQKALDEFQDFWESEVPRFGEAGATGWRQYVASGGDANAPEPQKDSVRAEASRDSYKAWANDERLQAQKAQLPARTMDEGTEEDPFRVVMYSDIEPLLFFIPEAALPRADRQLLNAFLIFSGLPPISRSDDWTEAAWLDQFLTGAKRDLGLQRTELSKDEGDETSRGPPKFTPINLHAAVSSDLLFPGTDWFSYLSAARFDTLDWSWIQNATGQLVHGAGVEDLALYHLALDSLREPSNVKKRAKGLLKRFPSNTALYDAYALAEHAQGNAQTARKVLSSAAELSTGSENPRAALLLWKTWAWIELEAGNKSLAVKRLCSSVDESLRQMPDDDSQIPGSYILKARQKFSSDIGTIPASGDDHVHVQGESLSLLAYLASEGCAEPKSAAQGNISAAMITVDELSYELEFRGCASTAAHERLLQFAARLLYFNATKGPFRRAYMREQLVKFIGYFPRNTVFWSLLEWSDSSLRVVDETRSLLFDKVLVFRHDCVSSRLFAIEHERNRGNANTTKAALEHAASSDTSKSSVLVWISYIRFCHGQKELRPKAKDVFYRALRHCPWSKEVMMEAFGTLVQDMESEELRAVYNTMSSKGLRIHVDLEEFLAKRNEGRTRRDNGRR